MVRDSFSSQEKTESPFRYQLEFYEKRQLLSVAVLHRNRAVTHFGKWGINFLKLDSSSSQLPVKDQLFIQNLMQFASLDASEGKFFIEKGRIAYFLSKLSKLQKVLHSDSESLKFSALFLTPFLILESSTASSISLKAVFENKSAELKINLEGTYFFSGSQNWILSKSVFYPVRTSSLKDWLEKFNLKGELVLSGSDAAAFLETDLPSLSEQSLLTLPKDFSPPSIFDCQPEVEVELIEEEIPLRLIARVHFLYESRKVPFTTSDQDLFVEVKKGDRTILLKRDLEFERESIRKLTDYGWVQISETDFQATEEVALDSIIGLFPNLSKEWKVLGQKLVRFHIYGSLEKKSFRWNFLSEETDWFSVQLEAEVGDLQIPMELIQSLLQQGKRYLFAEGKGYIQISPTLLKSFQALRNELDIELDPDGKTKIAIFHFPFLNELFDIRWKGADSIQKMIQALEDYRKIPGVVLSPNLEETLRPYQKQGIYWLEFLRSYRFHGILADDMGLGKTIQLLSYLRYQQSQNNERPSLVVAPTSAMFNWIEEAEKFTPQLKVGLYHQETTEKVLLKDVDQYDLIVTSYTLIRRQLEEFKKIQWKTIILDEAQFIKNPGSQTARAVRELKGKQRWALTGTPLENRLSELWSIFHFLMPGFLGSRASFRKRYQQPIEVKQDEEALSHLKKRIYPFLLRRMKEEVATELPPKTDITQYCEMLPAQRELYQAVLSASREQVLQTVNRYGFDRSHLSIFTALLRLRQICCHPQLLNDRFIQEEKIDSGKLASFEWLLEEAVSEGHRILVFSQFVEMLSILRKKLEEKNIRYEYLDGTTRNRRDKIRNFQENREIPVFLMSLRAGGMGINLTGADYVIHYDPWWNPAVEEQATDRVHRIGQKSHVFSYRLITKNSVEEKILMLQERKKNLIRDVLTKDSSFGKVLTPEDLEFLFS